MTDGERTLKTAETRIGEKYINVCVPKNNPEWHGPWDCAEFASWIVYQVGRKLYGCFNNKGNPAFVEAYTGAWQSDSNKIGKRIPVNQAVGITGAFLLRYPPTPGTMGHIAVSDGKGGTVEAMGRAYGVRRGKASGRAWSTGVLIPDFTYADSDPGITVLKPRYLYGSDEPNMDSDIVKKIQQSLQDFGLNPGPIDGIYGAGTSAAVAAFQASKGLIVDGQVGKQTAKRLKVDI